MKHTYQVLKVVFCQYEQHTNDHKNGQYYIICYEYVVLVPGILDYSLWAGQQETPCSDHKPQNLAVTPFWNIFSCLLAVIFVGV